MHFAFLFLSRQQLSKATFDSPPISPKTPASAVKCTTPRERGQKCNSSVLSHFFQKRPKTSPTKEAQHESSVAQCVRQGKSENARTHNANDGDLHSATAQLSVAVKEEPMDVEVPSIQGLMSVKQEDTGSHSISTGVEMAHSSSPSQDVKPVIKGEAFLQEQEMRRARSHWLVKSFTNSQSHSFMFTGLQNLHIRELLHHCPIISMPAKRHQQRLRSADVDLMLMSSTGKESKGCCSLNMRPKGFTLKTSTSQQLWQL